MLWHVDELYMSHVDSDVVSIVLAGIDTEYGKVAKMITTRGKAHKYLVITIEYSLPGKVIYSVFNNIGNVI